MGKEQFKKEKKQSKNKRRIVPKVVLTTILGVSISFSSINAQFLDDHFPRVYHVYLNGEHLGTVGSKDVVESFIKEKTTVQEQVVEDSFENVHLTISEDITYIPEVAFHSVFDNKEVLDKLEDKVSFSVEAVKLEIDGQVIGYFNNKETAEEALTKFASKYVSEDVLEKFSDPTFDPEKEKLKVGDSTILDVTFSEKVSFSKEKVEIDELYTVEQGVKMLEKGTLAEKIHEIQAGEVLGTIASKYDLTTNELLSLNPELTEDSILQIGQEVKVTGMKPVIDIIVKEEQLKEETIDYKVVYENTDSLFKGQTSVKQNGQEGKKKVQYLVTKKNGQVVEREVLDSEIIKEPVDKIILQGTKVIPSRGTGSFRWPTAGGHVTSHVGWRWGAYHKGIDIAGVSNRSIYAADNGTVSFAGWDGGYGNRVVINHNNGFKTTYSHLSSINVRPGQTVQKGQVIGVMGSTGNSTGTHLHFELYKNGSLQNPLSYY